MKRVELKRIAEILWKGTPADEKTPFAGQGTLPDNGSFSKNLESSDDIKKSKEFLDGEDEVEEPMSIPRKICFFLSLNVWVLYFVVLGLLIPCRDLECGTPYEDMLETNLSDIVVLTNMETMNVKGLPSLVMIGYGTGAENKLAALATFDATFQWNNTLLFIPRKIQCNFEIPFDANGDGIPDCLLSGYSNIYAFNATNGHVFWQNDIPSEKGNFLSGFHPTSVRDGKSFLIGTCGDQLVVIDAANGTKVSETSLPCESPWDIRIVPNVITGNFTQWNLVCDYGDKVEVWIFPEQDVLNSEKLEKANASEFVIAFSGSNSGGSIDLGCDVTPIPGGPLLLSWSDRVAMVTPEATWEKYFPEPLAVASIKVGHFSNRKELQIAAAVHNGSNTIVYIMEINNGTVIDSVILKDRQAESMEKIPDDAELLVLKSLFFNYTSQPVNNFTDPVPTGQTNFALVGFSKGSLKAKDITTTNIIIRSTLNVQTNGETDLLVIRNENGFTFYLKYIIEAIDSQSNVICIGSKHKHHYTFEP